MCLQNQLVVPTGLSPHSNIALLSCRSYVHGAANMPIKTAATANDFANQIDCVSGNVCSQSLNSTVRESFKRYG